MARRVPFEDPPALQQIAAHHAVLEAAIHLYYSKTNPRYLELFESDTADEVHAKRHVTLQEARAASAMTLLASIEASFRVDYRQRARARKKDDLSRTFKALYREKEQRASLSRDILQGWRDHSDVPTNLVGEIRSAFRYRDWLAHGRYWEPRLGRRYDFVTIYDLGREIESSFPFLRS